MDLSVAANNSFDNILFATDLSSASAAAMPYAVWLGRRFHSQLHIVNVVAAEIIEGAQPPDPFSLRHFAENRLKNMVRSEIFDGIRHRELVEEAQGNVSDVLLRLIRRLKVDLIVLGTHGRGGLTKMLLGSVSEELAYISSCSVLTVGPAVRSMQIGELKIKRILCATDLLPGSDTLLSYAVRLGENEHAKLDLLHTINLPSNTRKASSDFQRTRATTKLEQLVEQQAAHSQEIRAIVEVGSVAKQILRTAQELHADLIVIRQSSTSLPGLAAHLPWLAVHQLLSHAPCPVLTVCH